MKKTKKSKKQKLKEDAWSLFSLYIRLKYADRNGYVTCVTCGTTKHYKEMQAGHFIDSRNNSVLFNEMLVHPQCYSCNCIKHGNKVAYTVFMMGRYDLTMIQVEELDNLKFKVSKWKAGEVQEIHDVYKQNVEYELARRSL